jgi:hypothetical protein
MNNNFFQIFWVIEFKTEYLNRLMWLYHHALKKNCPRTIFHASSNTVLPVKGSVAEGGIASFAVYRTLLATKV